MAPKKRSSAASKKGGASRGKKPASSVASARSRAAQAASARHQTAAILLFAGAVLLLCLVLIPGASLWGLLHKFVLGLFGICAFILPVLMIYIAVIAAMERPVGSVSGKLWQGVLLLLMIGSALQIFWVDIPDEPGYGWFSSIGRAYTAGMELQGGGVAGALLGYPLEYFFTDIGAKIIICLLIFVFLMLVTGTTILTLFRTAWKPVEKTKASIEQVMVASAEKRQRPKKIDVDIGEGYVEQEPPAVDKKSKKAAIPTEEAPEALTALGIKHLIPVPEQMVIDGNFPTVVSPNPENPEGFYLAIDLAKKNDVDFILGTDPDSDRVGIMVRNHEGEFQPVTGNQTGVLLLDYLIGARKRSGKMPANPVALKTIVTTEMARKVAESNGVKCFDTFTGFKFMAEKKNALEESGEGKVIFSYEESYGYMLGDYVRDKDAVTASMLLTEMAAWYDAQGMTLFDALNALYEKYGWYAEKTHNLVMPGLDGLRDMAKLMKDLRENPPTEISGVKVIVRKDYTDGSVIDCVTGAKSRMELSGSNVLRYELEDGTVILVRPSGTEPKIKVYILTQGADAAASNANLEKYGRWVAALKP